MTTANSPKKGLVNGGAIAALVVMAAAAIGMNSAIRAYGFHLSKLPIDPPGNRQFSTLPAETKTWKRLGTDRIESSEVVEVLGTNNYVSRLYVEKDPIDPDNMQALDFHAAYYTGTIDTVPHVPERCFVGGGLQQSESAITLPLPMDTSTWVVDASVPAEFAGEQGAIYTVRLDNDRRFTSSSPGSRVRLPREIGPESPIKIRVSEFVGNGDNKIYAGYFFIANGGTVASANGVRTLSFSLTSDYAYYAKVQVTSVTVDSAEEFVEQTARLLSELIGDILNCVPDWVEVQAGRYPEEESTEEDNGPA